MWNKIKTEYKAYVLSVCALAMGAKAWAVNNFVVPSTESTQITADYKTAGAVILGLAVIVLGYRMVKGLIARRMAFLFGLSTAAWLALSGVSHAEGEYFTIPSADVTQITTDYKTAGAVILGLAVIVLGYRMVKGLIARRM